jgi:hypothetical protein
VRLCAGLADVRQWSIFEQLRTIFLLQNAVADDGKEHRDSHQNRALLKGPNPGVVFHIATFGTVLPVEVRRSLQAFCPRGHEGHEYLRIVLGLLSLVRQVDSPKVILRLQGFDAVL